MIDVARSRKRHSSRGTAGLGTLRTLWSLDQFSKLFSSPSPREANREINTSFLPHHLPLSPIGAIGSNRDRASQPDTYVPKVAVVLASCAQGVATNPLKFR